MLHGDFNLKSVPFEFDIDGINNDTEYIEIKIYFQIQITVLFDLNDGTVIENALSLLSNISSCAL